MSKRKPKCEELEVELSEAIESLPQRHYPKSCYEGSFVTYVDGVKDGLKEALQKVRMKRGLYKLVNGRLVK